MILLTEANKGIVSVCERGRFIFLTIALLHRFASRRFCGASYRRRR